MNLPSSNMKYSATDNTVSRPFLRQNFCSLSARPRQCEAQFLYPISASRWRSLLTISCIHRFILEVSLSEKALYTSEIPFRDRRLDIMSVVSQ